MTGRSRGRREKPVETFRGASGPSLSGSILQDCVDPGAGISQVGPTGKIGMLDTESGRARLYSDKVPGGFVVGELPPREHARPSARIDGVNEL